ncbi:radical SAM/SPASM domain-containing protein [Actinoplanes flavus]|uniref:Radical SAM protein n=1 Tax=Actinoplanes flavus TaxID=2820290 RepID=A0ABS3UUJ2_9ACTN|nr:radical SAM protein [Actinoplanes flavus]MBO3742247.1 radical SAM protein [Actinoplanes flavus]
MRESRFNIWVADGPVHHVYNGVSGATVRVPADQRKPIADFLAGDDQAPIDGVLVRTLADRRMIVADDADEIALLRRRYAETRRNHGRFHLTVVTSLGCNFSCPYCFEAKHPSLMDEPVQDRLLQVIDQKLTTAGELSVLWYGGEPLVGRDALLRLSDGFRGRAATVGARYHAAIVTNGYLLTPEVAAQLRAHDVTAAHITLDGPSEIHDRRRPLTGGRGTFDVVLANIVSAADVLPISIRVNLDTGNADAYEELLARLAGAGLAGRVTVGPAQVVTPAADPAAPSAGYRTSCLGRAAFAAIEREFFAAAQRFGFDMPGLPGPVGAPCTAVRDNELVVGSRGELYKCTETVGNPAEVVGNLLTWPRAGDRLLRWLTYEPFDDEECRSCPALPVCMGGCAYHAMDPRLRDSRCSTFRYTYREQVSAMVGRTASKESGCGPGRAHGHDVSGCDISR